MNFDPQKFFIGLMDFFSILLPGALLTYLLMGEVGPVVLGDRYSKLAGAEAWAAFLFASYLFGHLVFLLGAWLAEFYDRARPYTLNGQKLLLARPARARVTPGVTTQFHPLRGTDERYVILEGEGLVQVGDASPAQVRPLDVVAVIAGTPQRITNVGKADLVFLCVCTPRFRKETYLNLEGDGS